MLALDPNNYDAMQYLLLCWRAQEDLAEQPSEAVALKSKITAMQGSIAAIQKPYLAAGRLEPRPEVCDARI